MENEGDTPTGEDIRGAWAFANYETYWFSPDDHRYTSFDFTGSIVGIVRSLPAHGTKARRLARRHRCCRSSVRTRTGVPRERPHKPR